MTHDDVRSLGAEYALGVLDALARSVPQVAPPASLRARVLAEASRAGAPQAATVGSLPARRAIAARVWLIAASILLMAGAGAWQLLSTRERAREAGNAEQTREMAVIAAADVVRFDLRGADASARARALWSHRHGMVFTAEGLVPLPSGRTYQLWVISGGKPISAGVFSIAADGRARVVMATPESLTAVEAVAVTVEPEGGLPAPSTTPILAGAAATSE